MNGGVSIISEGISRPGFILAPSILSFHFNGLFVFRRWDTMIPPGIFRCFSSF